MTDARPSPSITVPELEGLEPAWSRSVAFVDSDGIGRRVQVLDSWNGVEGTPELTLLCVHGNPTWSYLWRRVLALAPAQWRVIAVDQVGMGFSDRLSDTDGPRRLAQRVDDLGHITEALAVEGPVATVAHDWGGPVSLGWALAHPDQLAAVVLANTAVTQPPGSPAPALIRALRIPGVLPAMTVRSTVFVRGALALGRGRLDPPVRQGFLAPYQTAARRRSIGDFVADIPLDDSHPSYATLAGIAEGVRQLTVPVLLLWGPDDPVFGDLYLTDLIERLPHADVHRYEGTSHLVTEQAPAAIPDLVRWLSVTPGVKGTPMPASEIDRPHAPPQTPRLPAPPAPAAPPPHLLSSLRARSADDSTAVVELGDKPRAVTWRMLAQRVDELAAGLSAAGVLPGDRVALLIPPGADLTACVYACWRMGAVIVAVDAGLGARGMGRALRGAAPDHLIAIPKGFALVRSLRLRISGVRVVVGSLTPIARALGAQRALVDLIPLGAGTDVPEMGESSVEAAVVFTSGATGPAKGVVYRRAALEAQRDSLRELYSIGPDDALVAAFAPWAVLGPALGIPSAVPDMDVTSPGSLSARALADAAVAVRATMGWASPAALRSAVSSAGDLSPLQRRGLAGVRLLMSAGAPVAVSLLEDALELMPGAEPHTPYGMTEVLPVSDISLAELRAAGRGDGVCVGVPIVGVTVAISSLGADGTTDDKPSTVPNVTGEILVKAAHGKDRYDRLWATEAAASPPGGWHRTGDVGHLDDQGRLWVEGRLQHVITTDRGPVTPVGVEQTVELLDSVRQAAAVGVGPRGTQQVVVVVVPVAGVGRSEVLASLDLIDQVRAAAVSTPVAAVLVRDSLPVDTRHNSKIDRAALARWAADVLAGRPSDGQDAS